MEDTTHIDILASGSRGNAALASFGSTRILIDCGVSFTQIRKRLEECGCQIDDLDAVFVTHEHSDHIRGLERLLSTHPDMPIVMSSGTCEALGDVASRADVHTVGAGSLASVGDVDIRTYALGHDAEEPLGLRIESGGCALGLATDLGHWTDEVAEAMEDVDVLILEANHDKRLLSTGPYPQFLKRRIGGSRGHLSNDQARSLLERVAHDELQHLVLAHMSETNNESLAAERLMAEVLVGVPTRITTALQHRCTPRIEVRARTRHRPPSQTSLF